MATRIKLRRDTAANWLEQNPILAQGETGFETDTRMMKLGDGATRWTDLKYAITGDLQVSNDTIHGDASVSLSSGIGNRNNWIVTTNSLNGDTLDTQVDGYADGVAYDSQGNAYSMGWYADQAGCFLQKISSNGEVLWNNYYNQYYSYGFGIEVDSQDNVIIILGEDEGQGGGNSDIVLVKISSEDGTIIWQKNINSYGDGQDYATCIDTDAAGNIFIVGSTSTSDKNCYVGKFSGANGNAIWQKQYDIQGFDDNGTGVCVDKDGNLGVVGTTSWDYEFIPVYKIDGNTGEFLWQAKVQNVNWDNGNQYTYSNVKASDICSDTNGDFYFAFTALHPMWPGGVSMVSKFNGSTGGSVWARRIGWDDFVATAGSVICDELDNLYVSSNLRKYKTNYDAGESYRLAQHITKFNATGSVIWQRFLSVEQAENVDSNITRVWDSNTGWSSQNIRVNSNYILVCGNHAEQNDYNDDSMASGSFMRPYVAQLNRDGAEFEVNGWSFKAADKDIQFVNLFRDDNNWEYDAATMSDVSIQVTTGDVNTDPNTDITNLIYINSTRENKVTFTEKTLTLPSGGSIDVGREKNGYFTAIGSFDGTEGGNTQGEVWLNGSARDDADNTYAAGGWYTNDTWHSWDNYTNIPLVFKTDATGKVIWQAGNALDQYGVDLVDVAYHAPTNTVIALGNDGGADGNEGFNILYLNADTGGMTQDMTHILPGNNDGDIWPMSLRVMTDGTPVVSGYVSSSAVDYPDVTSGGAGLPGSTNNGFLVLNKSVFSPAGRDTEYPTDDGNWYVYPAGASVYKVNSYGFDETSPTITYTGTLGSGLQVEVTNIVGGVPSFALVTGQLGTGYKAGHKIKVLGTALGGTTPNNDLYLYIDGVDGNGAVTNLSTSYDWEGTAPADGTNFNNLATTTVAPAYIQGWVNYSPTDTSYTFNKTNGGYYYGVGDTLKILGTALGGTSPANDLTITVTGINGTGSGYGAIDTFTVAGTPQTTTIRLYAGSADYTQSGTYSISHETSDDAFVWTPNWSVGFGTANGNNSDYAYTLALDSSDNVIIGGYSNNLGLNGDTTYTGWNQTAYVAKLSSTGEQLWAVSIDGAEGYSNVWGVAVDSNDNIYCAVESNNDDLYVTKLDSEGNFVWQRQFDFNWLNQPSIEITPEGDILIAVEGYTGVISNDYHHSNGNIFVLKLDCDGNILFTRLISTPDGLRTNNNDNYGNALTVKGNRYSMVGYSSNPGGNNYQGIVIDLPTDGTGVGMYGDFEYAEVELSQMRHYITNQDNWNYAIVTPVTMQVRTHTFNDSPYIDGEAWRNTTIYANRDYQVQTVYKPEGGEIKRVAKITFEDGSEQHTSMQGLPQVQRSRTGTSMDYWLRPEDNGKHIYNEWNSAVVIPDRERVNLPIGYAITIINRSNNTGVYSENNDNYIYLSGDGGNSNYDYNIPSWSMATLVKIKDNEWMIAGSGINSGWR